MALGNTIISQKDYPVLRGFLQSAAAQGQQQVALWRKYRPVPTKTAGKGPVSGPVIGE